MACCCLLNYVPHMVGIDDFSNIFGENYKYNLCLVVNYPSKKNPGSQKQEIQKE